MDELLRSSINEIKEDLKEIKTDFDTLNNKLTRIEASMPSADKVQALELEVMQIKTQFKIVWAGLAGAGFAAIGSVVVTVLRLLGMG